ncbi:MAG: hypothetical protein RL559_1181 [Pseudomonadota bacterium]
MNRTRCFLFGLSALCAVSTWAAEASAFDAWLPGSAQVAPVLQASPAIQAARAQQEARQQRARGVEAGSAEWTVRLNQQQRRAQDPSTQRFAETTLALERPLRLWGKADLDAQLATQDREIARIGLADAMHETSRQLLQQWFGALRAKLEVDNAARELELAATLQRQAQVRLRQGDISRLDAGLADAEWQRAQAAAALAQVQQASALAQLQRLYPGLPTPRWPERATPKPVGDAAFAPALQDFLQHQHELNLLKSEVQRQQLLADRLERDRRPDPTVGLYGARERAGAEQLLGVTLALPLSGVYRDSLALSARAEAESGRQRVQLRQQQLSADFESRWRQVEQQALALQALRQAAATQREAADKSFKAYSLGEHSMTELIQNRRLAKEQQLASDRLLLELVQAQALIALDRHQLWDLDD